ncbi:Hypothetical_protein [Hexamita inflata]|uniref:Hypothetical_protein n=1 Tax=Hexamita inflata TaxID=28002 RepID=A0AA86T9V1_9EUKA|nr:Hypothetical protein HINF_LOCUS76 [Hexamita inflata]
MNYFYLQNELNRLEVKTQKLMKVNQLTLNVLLVNNLRDQEIIQMTDSDQEVSQDFSFSGQLENKPSIDFRFKLKQLDVSVHSSSSMQGIEICSPIIKKSSNLQFILAHEFDLCAQTKLKDSKQISSPLLSDFL